MADGSLFDEDFLTTPESSDDDFARPGHKNYGMPYKGSKNKLAKKIVDALPAAPKFYDLFCGGCAVTHAALESGKFGAIVANDISDYPQVFLDAIHGKFRDEKRWISREDYYRLKDKEPYVRFCWSFGNNGRNYLYAKEIEPWKKAVHYARVFGDFSLLRAMGIDLKSGSRRAIKRREAECKAKYIKWYCREVLKSSVDELSLQKNLRENIERNEEKLQAYLLDGLKKAGKRPGDVDKFLGTNGMAGHYFGKSQWEFPTREIYIKLQGFLFLPTPYEEIYGLQELLASLERLASLECLASLERLERLERLASLYVFCEDYRKIKVEPGSVIYCDIPYRGTDGYGDDKNGGFDHEAFYKWAAAQTSLVVVSEYAMPPDFVCVAAWKHRSTLSGTANNEVTERLFVPAGQMALWNKLRPKKWTQGELF